MFVDTTNLTFSWFYCYIHYIYIEIVIVRTLKCVGMVIWCGYYGIVDITDMTLHW